MIIVAHTKTKETHRNEKLSDARVVEMRRAVKLNPKHGAQYFATLWGLSASTLQKAIYGVTYKSLDVQEAPYKRPGIKLTEDAVREMRTIVRHKGVLNSKHYSALYDVSEQTIGDAVRGHSFQHLNESSPPIASFRKEKHHKGEDMRAKARALYQEGKTYPEIKALLGISKSSISLYCRDLVRPRPVRDVLQHRKMVKENPEIFNGNQIITRQQVADMRKEVRQSKQMNLRHYAQLHNVSVQTISSAIRGISFKSVNDLEPPITEYFAPQKGTSKKKFTDENLVIEAIALRRQDPATWTYKALAQWFKDKTDRNYLATHVAHLLLSRDPSLKALEPVNPSSNLTIDDVVALRKTVRQEQKMNLLFHAKRLGVSHMTISHAIRGRTFKDADVQEPPVTEAMVPTRDVVWKPLLDESLITHAIHLRKVDPTQWTYAALGTWLTEKTNRRYTAGTVANLLIKREPALKELEALYPTVRKRVRTRKPKITKPKVVSNNVIFVRECVVCERTFKSRDPEAEVCFDKSCKDIIAAHDE